MKAFLDFYNSRLGRIIVDALIGLAVGTVFYLWRGNAIAPFLCAVASAFAGFFIGQRMWNRKV